MVTSIKLRRARAMFGLTAEDPDPRCGIAPCAADVDRALRPGGLALVTGPSGAGKTTILRAVGGIAAGRGEAVIDAWDPGEAGAGARAVVDLFDLPLRQTLALLARAGLADATLYGRRADQLSAGERFRLWVALGMARAESSGERGSATLLIDEFGSLLDPLTAAGVARTLRRWTSASRVRVVCASPHNSLMEALGPDVLVYQPLLGPAVVREKGWRGEP